MSHLPIPSIFGKVLLQPNNATHTCTRKGKYTTSVHDGKRQRGRASKKIGCKAHMGVKMNADGGCVIKRIHFEHNHQLTLSPSMLVFLHSHKRVNPTLQDYIKDLQLSTVKHVNIMSFLTRLSGGRDKLGCHNRDVLNMKAKNARKESAHDVQKLFKFFDDMTAENENFYYDVHVGEDNRLNNIFWANASCRVAYADFGDCITFDTTYKSNKFHLPLAVFVGLSNHLLSSIFGVALMGDESVDSFKWYQCPSMATAIPQIFPRSLHKLCRWHIMRKHKDSLGKLYKLFPDLKDQLPAVLNHPLMPTEFEAAWHELVNKYNLHDVNVMVNLWNERKTWIFAYWKDVLCACMTSTQRSESMNHVLKNGFVREQHDLHIFAQQVNNCIQTRHESEAAEAIASMGVMKPLTRYGFDAQILEHYTRAVYGVFRERQFHSTGFRIKTSSQNTTEFLVHHYNQSREFAWSSHEFHL
ncbi:hypothetical protein BRADI_5g03565v3 [Brachypodium distachyon]|uniref:Protein FAR1-RELATED SEQUENCE n=1 Tax=Brachypodium distachyon TaxID=15368 RepID=A0A0Q3H1G6_BRADI|nr:hypothetical protein BRADI_5g03565v3 [Brachypodium distachyon]